MRSDLICTLLVIVSSVYSQRPHARYSENLKKVVPHHYKNDKETIDRGVDQVARGHKVEPPLPPLRPHQTVPWLRWVQEGRWAAQADKNSELHRVRARLLEEKLRPNQFAFKPIVNPQLKPKINQRINARTKREVGKSEVENVEKESEIKANVRHKREVIMPRAVPELIMQPHVGAEVPLTPELYKGRAKETEKRDKRQIIYFINRPPQLMARSPRTTPNPFIRDTHIEEYDIIRPEVGEREGMIPTVESGSSDLGSYPLVNEEETEFSKIISQFYLTTSDEYWPQIQQFSDNIMRPLSQLMEKKKELTDVLETFKDIRENFQEVTNAGDRYNNSTMDDISRDNHQRVKRRVNKTLKRKRAKKKKQRLRRFERKRLRMLTHARRVRRQQKSKQARLQRHYARMNMTTTAVPDHLRNQTLIGEAEEQISDGSTSKDDDDDDDEDEEESEEDEEYESSEYEDESDESKDESEESADETKDKSKGKPSKSGQEESEESDKSGETEESDLSSKPDYGNDDYESYDDEYEDDDSSEESEKKGKKNNKAKKLKAMTKRGRKNTLHMLNRQTKKRRNENVINKVNDKKTFKGQQKPGKDEKVNAKAGYKSQQRHIINNNMMSIKRQPLMRNIR